MHAARELDQTGGLAYRRALVIVQSGGHVVVFGGGCDAEVAFGAARNRRSAVAAAQPSLADADSENASAIYSR